MNRVEKTVLTLQQMSEQSALMSLIQVLEFLTKET